VALDDPFWQGEEDLLYGVVFKFVAASGTAGAQAGVDDLLAQFGVGVDWGLVSSDVQQWAQRYSGELVKGITKTNRQAVGKAIADWQESGQPMADLIDSLTPMFGETRAALIASTEVTRAFHQGNLTTWKDSGVVEEWKFMTAMDELVCPECGPLSGQTFALNDDVNAPPIHPRCRCWSQPVVRVP